jgi:hypothetical protein
MFQLDSSMGFVLLILVHPNQGLCVLHFVHSLFQIVSSCLNRADLAFRIFLPAFIRFVLLDQAFNV